MAGDDVSAGLDAHSYPLDSMHPDGEQLPVFESSATKGEIVGLGEATHGTHELFTLKQRLLCHLVAECGFRTVAFETDFVNTLALDEFVHHGVGTPADALDDLILWVWKTETIRDTVEWLRTFNVGRPPEDRVRIYGVSLSNPSGPADRLRTVLSDIDRAIPEQDRLTRLADEEIPDNGVARDSFLDSGITVAATLRDHLNEHREEFVEQWSERGWETAVHLCRHLEQNCEWNRLRLATEGFNSDAFECRDQYMAENATWCVETDPGNGVIVWAHNTHIKRGSFDMAHEWASGTTMGEFLTREHGSRYHPYATDFAHGAYRAVANADTPQNRGVRTITAIEPPTASATAVLDSVDTPNAFFNIERAADDSRLTSWVKNRQLRAVSAVVDPSAGRERRIMETDLDASFDGLFVAEETTPSIPLDTVP
ncbi:erythromycin esterase family protein [Halovenus rubra]|uniref:Erythromycin esterase family protein n=2 Tax=Halovenus rubra TaxID=869890 RepID=A0ABD5X5S0_9EURY|nr:erythromycin esterase family protein [Halovenus rubra]